MSHARSEWVQDRIRGAIPDGGVQSMDSDPTLVSARDIAAETGQRATLPNESRGDSAVDEYTRHDTPLIPAPPIAARGTACATLTIMSGLDAGRVVSIRGDVLVIGRSPDVDLCIDDPGISRRHARIARTRDGGFYVEDLGSTNGTMVGGERVGVARIDSGDYLQIGATLLLRFAFTDSDDVALRQQIYESSIRDPLTRAYNRKYLADRSMTEIAHARRSGEPLALLMLDVDRFKEFNDRYGHLAGDRVVCFVAAQMQRMIRVEDTLARYGGEEFVVLARGTPHDEAALLAERLRRAIESLCFSAGGHSLTVTVSIGVASFSEIGPCDEPGALIALADERLYCAKLRGRNLVCART